MDCIIRGLGRYAPARVVTNAELEKLVDTTDEWITTRTGIKERHLAAKGEVNSDLAVAAAKAALADAGMQAEELTHILLSTFTADAYVPAGAPIVQEKLGLKNRMAMDQSAACSGFLYSLETARALIALHPQAKVLVVAAEVLSSRTNWADRATCVLFGDGAGAAVVTAGGGDAKGGRILDVLLSSDGGLADLLTVRGGASGAPYALGDVIREDFFVQMQGREVYKHAVRSMTAISQEILARHGLTTADVDLLVPHQANLRIIEAVGDKLGIPREKTFINVQKYGNTSAAALPMALAEAKAEGAIRDGALVLAVTFGGGFTWAASLIRFETAGLQSAAL